jgi:uncharacterized protein (DUF1800 family)
MATVHFAPYDPGKSGAWDRRTASHLLRRAGFGAARPEIEQAVKAGLEATVEGLFEDARAQESEFQDLFQHISNALLDFTDVTQLQAWWCYRMRQSRTPLREKLTLFWHGHFATSYQKVEDVYLIHRQCETLRQHAWGSFRDLVLAVARDPAMLVYLDGEANTKEHPNENFARELMELFTVGLGHYTEKDVQEAARAFTGWHREGANFVFHADQHDDGPKQFLGKKGNLDGGDVLEALLEQPALPRFLARKLLVFFACPEPPADVLAEAADVFSRGRLNVRRFLTELFQSRFFYSAACRRTRIASPAELVVGTCRTLNVRQAAPSLRDNLNAMTQELFAPPNVKGWDGEKKWINASTWAARQAFGQATAALASAYKYFGAQLDVGQLVPADMVDPEKIVETLVDLCLDGELEQGKRAELAKFLITAEDGEKADMFRDDAGFREQQTRELLGVILSLPEYHAY